ncbi:MAG: hypothetical protein MK137_04380 [Rickettsiales bacterium]|nr:hypothetical protein [Rickettsiales bacterium]
MATTSWKEWAPGLNNDTKTLGEMLETLPGNNPESINFIVRLFENPSSPIALSGAITLERHDCIHILLGRGLLPQDEAFVIGFTMGTVPTLRNIETWLFKKISQHLYPKPYNFNQSHLEVYDIGLQAGKEFDAESINTIPLETYTGLTMAEIRQKVGIDTEKLKIIYRKEHDLYPDSPASKRLLSMIDEH